MINDPDMWRICELFLKKHLSDPVEFNFADRYTIGFIIKKIGEIKLKHAWLMRFSRKYSRNKIADRIVTGLNMQTMEFIYEAQPNSI